MTPSEKLQMLFEIEKNIFNLQHLKRSGLTTGIDTAIDGLNKNKFEVKEALVLEVHTHKITELTVKKHGKMITAWQTRTHNKKRPRCYSYEKLIDTLFYVYYGNEALPDYTFKSIFIAAVDEKKATVKPKKKTIDDYWDSYNAFISDEFGARDIRTITPSEMKTYMQEVTQRLAPKVKRFYKFKGILNLVFEYATDPEHCYIAVNPVPKENLPYLKNCTYSSRKPEDKAFQPDEVKKIREYLWKRVESRKYDVNGYAILFASESGCREAELPALKWEDVLETDIHIHAQQNDQEVDGEKCYYYNPTTKNEKGVSHDGRLVPMTDGIRKVLTSLREKQESLGIVSEWVFCKEDGTWITTAGYSEALYRLCKETLGLKRTNNHAFRIALNSYEFIPAGLDVATRAKILGHSVEVNLRDYTFEKKDYITEATEKLNAFRMAVT